MHTKPPTPMKLTGRSANLVTAAFVLCLVLLPAAKAVAQDEAGPVVGATASAASMRSGSAFSFGGSAGYQFTRMFGIEIEASAVPTLEPSLADDGFFYPLTMWSSEGVVSSGGTMRPGVTQTIVSILPRPTEQSIEERTVFFTTNVRVQMPTGNARLTPFFVAGGGAAHVRRTAEFLVPIFPGPLDLRAPIPIPVRTRTERVISASTGLALTMGGGVDVRIARRFAVGADLRYYRLLAERDTNAGRFGVGLRYRF